MPIHVSGYSPNRKRLRCPLASAPLMRCLWAVAEVVVGDRRAGGPTRAVARVAEAAAGARFDFCATSRARPLLSLSRLDPADRVVLVLRTSPMRGLLAAMELPAVSRPFRMTTVSLRMPRTWKHGLWGA